MFTLYDEFAGAGGTGQGCDAVPGVQLVQAANHNKVALETHGANFPDVDHILGDVTKEDITRFARADIFCASPACPPWTDARGVKRDFDKQTPQAALPGMPEEQVPVPDEKTMRARKLMEEIPRYLKHWKLRGKPILAGVVENVIQCRKWVEWDRWLNEIREAGPYEVRIIAFNSMHAVSPDGTRPPQSRDRLYVAYWLSALPREPDWDKWLRPRAWCEGCDEMVNAMQVFKKPGVDMGRYGPQYVFRCPRHSCRGRVLQPATMPAMDVIDWSIPGTRIGDRETLGMKPLQPATMNRIRVGLAKYAVPLLSPAGGTWRDAAAPVTAPMPTRTTRDNDALVVPPLLVPTEGRPGKTAAPADRPVRTQTRRNETGVAWLPFITPMRGGGDKETARPIDGPLHTVTAGGNHHGLVVPDPLLVPYYGKGNALPVTQPMGVQPTRDRWALAVPGSVDLDAAVADVIADIDLNDVLFRMLHWEEIKDAMAFRKKYVICGTSSRVRVQQLGNAVTPPVMTLIMSALVEALSGETLSTAQDLGLAA